MWLFNVMYGSTDVSKNLIRLRQCLENNVPQSSKHEFMLSY